MPLREHRSRNESFPLLGVPFVSPANHMPISFGRFIPKSRQCFACPVQVVLCECTRAGLRASAGVLPSAATHAISTEVKAGESLLHRFGAKVVCNEGNYRSANVRGAFFDVGARSDTLFTPFNQSVTGLGTSWRPRGGTLTIRWRRVTSARR